MTEQRSRGNVKEQRKRRRKRLKTRPIRYDCAVELIDGNWTMYPCAFCKRHNAFLTEGLIDTHKCIERECGGLKRDIYG